MTTDIISPVEVANFLICESRERGDLLTNLKLQKLLFYSQAWFLVLADKPLFREDFKAWMHGPVLPSQYIRFKEYEWRPITEDAIRYPTVSLPIKQHLNEIINVFGVESATALELMTHNEKPWMDARGDSPADERSSKIISKESMQEFYSSLIAA